MMWLPLVVVVCTLGVAFANTKDGKMGKSKSKSFVYSGHVGSLAKQYLELKAMFVEAQKKHRELIVVQSKDELSGEVSYNLCDVFDLPGRVSCVKHMKMKCDKEKKVAETQNSAESEKADKKKKIIYYCDPPRSMDNAESVSSTIDLIPILYDFRLNAQRYEEIEYIQSVLGYASKGSKLLRPYTVIYWEQAAAVVGKCKQSSAEADCATFKQATQALLATTAPHCAPASPAASVEQRPTSPMRCYIAGATHATAQEAGYLLDQGLLSFRGAWLQHHKDPKTGLYDEAALMPINAVSMEVMEWGVMMGAEKFVAVVADSLATLAVSSPATDSNDVISRKQAAGEAILLTSMVEHERAKDGKSYCFSHKEGANDLKALPGAVKTDFSWCGRLKERNFVYTPKNSATDDGPFENATLNRFTVSLALYLLNVFSSRPLQLLLGGMCVVLLAGVSRFCFLRWRRATNKTF